MTYFYEGTLHTNKSPFYVKHLGSDDIDTILDLQDIVVQTLNHPDQLQPLSLDELQYITSGNGMIIGAFSADRLIAFRALLVPPVDEDGHLGRDVGLKEEELKDVIYQEISNVHPDYRGNRLQQQLAKLIMEELSKDHHSYKYVCATVMPFNIPSLKDKLNQGMRIAALKEKYEGRLRYVFVKELDTDQKPSWSMTKEMPMSDIEGQQFLLKEGWSGFKMELWDGNYIIVYGK